MLQLRQGEQTVKAPIDILGLYSGANSEIGGMRPSVGCELFEFEDFTLDLARGCLRAGDRQIDLRPKSFAVLRYFLENAGRLISKEELVGTAGRFRHG
jgi:DNA-binding response OmpR family regulator